MSAQPTPHAPRTASPLQPRMATLAALVLLVAVLHAALLGSLPVGAGRQDGSGPRPLSVRQIVVPAAAEPAAAVPPPQPAQPARRAATSAPTREQAPPPAPQPIAQPDVAPDPAPEPDAVASAEPAASAPALAAVDGADTEASAALPVAAPVAPPEGEARVPTYATRLPPAALLHYEMRRGVLAGRGELAWRPSPDGYEMVFEGVVFGMPVLAWVSRGGVDAAGLAPQRFVDRRRGRDIRAANFQRDSARITYSSSTAEHALLPGAQDRLSWMLQLAAIFEADPARFTIGDQLLMQVAGARGEADIWTFTLTGHEPVDLVGDRVSDALVLRREPRRPFDTQVDVWLDPARHHLPVRLRLTTQPGGDSNEFVLRP